MTQFRKHLLIILISILSVCFKSLSIDLIDMAGAKAHSLGNIMSVTDQFLNPAIQCIDVNNNTKIYNQIDRKSVV